MNYGTLIRNYRINKDLTQATLANEVGISTRTLRRYEHNMITSPDINNLANIAKILGVSINDIYESEDMDKSVENNENHNYVLELQNDAAEKKSSKGINKDSSYYELMIDRKKNKYNLQKIEAKEGVIESIRFDNLFFPKEDGEKYTMKHIRRIESIDDVLELLGFGGYGIMSDDIYKKYFADTYHNISGIISLKDA